MSTFYLINKIRFGTRTFLPGALINDTQEDAAGIRAAGGRLYASANAIVAAAAANASTLALRGQHDQAGGIMLAAASEADAGGLDSAVAASSTPAIASGLALVTNASTVATNQATTGTNVAEARSGHVRITNPIAADLVTIKAAADVADGTITIAAQPDVPRKLQVRIVDANSSISAGTLTLVGVGPSGEVVGQAIPLTGGTQTVTTTQAYATLTSGTVASLAGAAAGDTLGIGPATALGLPGQKTPASTTFAVYKACVDDANETIGTVDATAGTIVPTTAPDGARDYDFWFTYAVTVVQASHNHTQDTHTHTATDGGHIHTQAAHTHVITLS